MRRQAGVQYNCTKTLMRGRAKQPRLLRPRLLPQARQEARLLRPYKRVSMVGDMSISREQILLWVDLQIYAIITGEWERGA